MKLLVIGDSCLDIYIYGKCERLCPDAPVPILLPIKEVKGGGMAYNVKSNIESLDIECDIITNKTNITKTRYVDIKTNQMLVRVDSDISKVDRIQNIKKIPFQNYDAIIISDYCKGFLEEEDIEFIASQHNNTFLDTKKILGEWCNNISFIKINEMEFERTKRFIHDEILNKIIITTGSKGCIFKEKIYPVNAVEVKDMTGAGDTFISALSVMYIKTKNIEKSISFANKCATIVVQKRGVNVIDKNEII
jgi:bifunctional ADP-heptose synthase (sugar kinase/adenylyltransferase)